MRAGVMGEKHLAFLSARAAFAEQVLAAEDAFAAAAAAEGVSFPSKPPNTKVRASGDPAALALDGELVACKEEAEKLREALKGTGAREGEREKFYAAGRVAAALSGAVLAFSEAYAEEKRRAGALDFADLEHKCLALLENPQVRAEVAGRYTHVFVDEYQDVNPVQERILSLVAGKNVFMVGDAKQSIYGFRGCSSAFFTQKFERLSAEGRALTLNANFRSRTAVLDAVNRIFSKVMTRENGAVDYAATAMMRAGTPEQAGGAVHVAVARAEEKEEPLPRGVYSVAEHIGQTRTEEYPEGALIADIVLEELRGTLPDAESEGGRRGVGYGDIVVLTRNKTGRAGAHRRGARAPRHPRRDGGGGQRLRLPRGQKPARHSAVSGQRLAGHPARGGAEERAGRHDGRGPRRDPPCRGREGLLRRRVRGVRAGRGGSVRRASAPSMPRRSGCGCCCLFRRLPSCACASCGRRAWSLPCSPRPAARKSSRGCADSSPRAASWASRSSSNG